MERKRLTTAPLAQAGGDYFPDNRKLDFLSSGCTVLDCVLGGGWALGRVANVVGDRSTGKTLLAIEACANMDKQHSKGKIFYREAEAAFDEDYAIKLGLPLKKMDFGKDGLGTHWDTVEDIFEDMEECANTCVSKGVPGLYIVDSLDALSSRASMARKVGDASYNLEKQKVMSELFQHMVRPLREANMALLVVSQVRDRIGFVVGEKHRRSGGKALDFYATHILWLSHIKTLVRTINSIKRATAVQIKAKCKKNKVTMPFRDCEFTIRFGFGVDDVDASVSWLEESKLLKEAGLTAKGVDTYLSETQAMDSDEYRARASELRECVMRAWSQVEDGFRPTQKKYG